MIVAGFGFRAAATADSLRDALARAGKDADALATAADKAEAPAFRALADALSLPVTAVPPEALAAQETATHSEASLAAHGTGSVAEAAALAAAGPGARLLAPRAISGDRMATCALATTRTEATP
ncbi:cobalamin biosynthesis protein [Citreimonas salinaria]|uniref:Cobalt-precorrin 5A hydrolase n=1 Tax=Citreimonas salinaria TaxID=321339 RepID=A0A1H3IVA9_9RHOB|nr:cobalamin biosynthesis protein [Citreimonas salinaria]SDY31179.1 cobalt-precorrin 5A hydrolase [Citreimonas salinaria]